MDFKLFLVAFCAFQFASCATVDEEYQAYLDEYQRLTETVDRYKEIVTDHFGASKLRWFNLVQTKINTIYQFLGDLQGTGYLAYGEAGLQCVTDRFSDVSEASEKLRSFTVENLENAQQIADSIADECDNATATAIEEQTSVELGWSVCAEDDIPCKEEVVKSANEFIEEFSKNVTNFYNDRIAVFQESVVAKLSADLDTQTIIYTRQFTNVIGLITQCWNNLA